MEGVVDVPVEDGPVQGADRVGELVAAQGHVRVAAGLEVARVARAHRGLRAPGGEVPGGVAADERGQAEPRGRRVVGEEVDELEVDEARQAVEHLGGARRRGQHDRSGALQRERPLEDRQLREQRLVLLGEQAVGPVERRVHARVAVVRQGVVSTEEADAGALAQLSRHHGRRDRGHPRGGELDGQREPADGAADRGHVGEHLVGDPEATVDGRGVLDEQRDGRGPGGALLGRRERADPHHLRAVGVQRPQAGRHHEQPVVAGEEAVDESADVGQLVDLVEDEEQRSAFVPLPQGTEGVRGEAAPPGELRDDLVAHERRLPHRAEGHEQAAAGAALGVAGQVLERDAGLADAGRPDERHEPRAVVRGQVGEDRELAVPTEDRGFVPTKRRSRSGEVTRLRHRRSPFPGSRFPVGCPGSTR